MDDFDFELTDTFGNTVNFTSLEHLAAFISDEREHWQWLIESDVGHHDVSSRFNATFSDIDSWINQSKSGAMSRDDLSRYLSDVYSAARPRILFSEIGPGATVQLIYESLDIEHAMVATGLVIGVIPLDLGKLQHARLWSMIALPSVIEPSIWVENERNRLARARDALRRELTNHRKRISDVQGDLTSTNQKARKAYRKLASRALKSANRQATEIKKRAISSIEQITATDAAYSEQMALKAPVSYWGKKSASHKNGAIAWGIVLVLYISASVAVGIHLFKLAWDQASNDGFNGKNFLLAIGIGTVLTLIFWVSRVLMRIFLGELHLYTDAEERRVMTETYLALIKENGASENERALILAALFRSAQDGIVKEDVGGEVGLAAIAAKLLDGRKT